MTRLPQLAGLLLAVACATAGAQTPAGDAEAPSSRLIAQKLRLVESLLEPTAAPSAAGGGDAETRVLVREGHWLIERTRQALAAQRYDDAGSAADAALRHAVKVSARRSSQAGTLGAGAQQASYGRLLEQVATYRRALDDVSGSGAGQAREAAGRVDTLRSEAAALANGGRIVDANRKLGEAYRHAVETLSRLRAGQTVTLSLNFATPADEYRYELQRFESSEILVGLMINEGRADGARTRVDGFLREGRRLHGVAAASADSGDHGDAITAMEEAAAQLNLALQAMGLPAF